MNPIYKSNKLIEKERKEGIDVYDLQKQSLLSQIFNWVISTKTFKAVFLTKWLSDQVNNASKDLLDIAEKIPQGKNDDETSMNILRYVTKNLKYIKDELGAYKSLEYWQTAEETIKIWEGDCEDGSILIYVLCRLKGISENKLYLVAGDVKGGGHAFCVYKPINYPYNYAVLDWCYWYSNLPIERRNIFSIVEKDIEEWKPNFVKNNWDKIENSNYYSIWFMVNERKSMTRVRLKKGD